MQRYAIALGVTCLLMQTATALAQMTGSWLPSPPNSKAIVYDKKGRRLFWDANGQIVGRYSFATGRYIAELPGKQRKTLGDLPGNSSPGAGQKGVDIVTWRRGRPTRNRLQQAEIASPPIPELPQVVWQGTEEIVEQDDSRRPRWSVSSGPHEMP